MTVKQFLNTVYKAKQCTDINDCDIALSEIEKYTEHRYKRWGITIPAAIRNRKYSIENRKKQL